MHKLTFKNKHGQEIQLHGKVISVTFMTNDNFPVVCNGTDFISIDNPDDRD